MTSPYARAARPFVGSVGLPAAFAAAAAVAIPIAGLVREAFRESFRETLGDPSIVRAFLFTYAIAGFSALVAVAFGVVGGLVVAERDTPVARSFERLSLATVALPPIVFASGLFSAFGRAGWLGDLGLSAGFFGVGPLALALVLFNVPLAVHGIATGLRRLDRGPERVALTLGASPWRVAWAVTVPRLGPEIGTAFLLAFLYCATSFLLPLLVGASPRYATVEVRIFEILTVDGRVGVAAQLATIHFVACAGLLAVLPRRKCVRGGSTSLLYAERTRRPFGFVSVILAAASVAALGLPFAALLVQGARGASALAADFPFEALRGSALAAAVAAAVGMALSVPLGYFAARGGRRASAAAGALAFLPLAFSPLLLFFAWRTAFGLDAWEGSATKLLVIVGAVHAITTLPLGFRHALDAFSALEPATLAAAATLGAGPARRFFLLELPAVAPAFFGLAALFAAASWGEVSAVLLVGRSDVTTLPVAMYRAMGQYRFASADALGALLFVTVSLLLAASGWAVRRAGAKA